MRTISIRSAVVVVALAGSALAAPPSAPAKGATMPAPAVAPPSSITKDLAVFRGKITPSKPLAPNEKLARFAGALEVKPGALASSSLEAPVTVTPARPINGAAALTVLYGSVYPLNADAPSTGVATFWNPAALRATTMSPGFSVGFRAAAARRYVIDCSVTDGTYDVEISDATSSIVASAGHLLVAVPAPASATPAGIRVRLRNEAVATLTQCEITPVR